MSSTQAVTPQPVNPTQERSMTLRAQRLQRMNMNNDHSTTIGKKRTRPSPPPVMTETMPSSNLDSLAFTTGSRPKPSGLILEKEKNTKYWQSFQQVVQEGSTVDDETLKNVISRAMSLGIVGDKKQRQSIQAPQPKELLQTLEVQMEKCLTQLGSNDLLPAVLASHASLLDKVVHLDRALSLLETKRIQHATEHQKQLQTKLNDLENSLSSLRSQKEAELNQNRKTMCLEIQKLKEAIASFHTNQNNTNSLQELQTKMARMEIAMRLLNDARKKSGFDKETLDLKQKITDLEEKLRKMEEEKKLREKKEEAWSTKDKLTLLDERLAKMEKRKSNAQLIDDQKRMMDLEKQISTLQSQRAVHPNNTKILQHIAHLEHQLQELSSRKTTPIQDPETMKLRNHIETLEHHLTKVQSQLEQQTQDIETDRKVTRENRTREEDMYRREVHKKQQEMLNRVQNMEKMIGRAGGEVVDGGPDGLWAQRLIDMEKKLEATQKELEEQKAKRHVMMVGGDALKDEEIARLKVSITQSLEKLEEMQSLMDRKMKQFPHTFGKTEKICSGMSYKELSEKLSDIQKRLFSSDINPQENEKLNIQYEKLITELENTAEYQNEQEQRREKWKKENEAPNKAAHDRVCTVLRNMPDMKLSCALLRKTELRLLLRTPEQILKMHGNDFKQMGTLNLNLLEARALFHHMPEFRKDQEPQRQFVGQLQIKIEDEVANSKSPVIVPSCIGTKKVVIKTQKKGEGNTAFLDELLQRRKRTE